METFWFIILYIIPLLGCMSIITYLLKYKDTESVVLLVLFIFAFMPGINFVISFLIIGSYLLDKLRNK